jgi:hypothetical protein
MIRSAALLALALAVSACDGAAPTPATGDDMAATPAAQVTSDNPELCTLGLKVLTPGGKLGTVTKVEGGGCTVTVDETGLSDVWAEFMLEPAPGTAPPMEQLPGAPQAGWYQCYAGGAGNFRVEIRNGNTYANSDGQSGSYTFDPATSDVTWTSGPWTDFYSRVLKDGDIGVTMKPDRSFFGITCEREG